MKITLSKPDTSLLTPNASAIRRCQAALEFKDRGDYDGAQEVMEPFWKRLGERPNTEGLHAEVAAEVLLHVGILTRWIGSKNQSKEAQRLARDLISESITFYESVGDVRKVAEARAEIAYCYWRDGELNEARIMFTEALQKLTTEGNTRANALLGLSVVEWSASRYDDALKILTDNALLFKKIPNHTTKGFYHNQLAMILRKLATAENKTDNLRRAIREYEQADYHFKAARNICFRADVKNNVAYILRELSRLKEAHKSLEEARRLAVALRDKVKIAQIDDSRALIFMAQNRFKEAEIVSRSAASIMEKGGHQSLLADLLITHGTALARLRKTKQAQFTFQKAIEVSRQVGALNKAGMAALTLIEELDELSPQTFGAAYERANEWLAESQSPDLLRRINAAASKVLAKVQGELITESAADVLANRPLDFDQELLRYENALIKHALAQVNGSVTRAAANLSISYQKLAYIIETRHRDLLKDRSPVRRRQRKEQ